MNAQDAEVLKPKDPDQARAIGFDEERREDGAIEAEIRQRMRAETGIDPHLLMLTVTGGKAVLEGPIDGRPSRLRLMEWIPTVPGVKGVIDRLTLLDPRAVVLEEEHLTPEYRGLPEVSRPMPEYARRCGEATG